MFTWKRFILASATTLLLVLLIMWLVLPNMIIDRATLWVAEETGRALEIESISIHPFSLSAEIHKLQLSDMDQTGPFVSWELLRISLSLSSLYHRAPVIDELRLDKPYLHLERLTADRFNFSDLILQQEDTDQDKPAQKPVRFSVNNLSINNGQIDLVDSSLEEQVKHSIRDLQLVLPTIGNLPYMAESLAKPLFRAVINDSPIAIEGALKPFSDVQEMQFALNLYGLDLPFYLDYIPLDLPIEIRNGKLSVDLDIIYRISPTAGSELEVSGRINLATLDIWDRMQEQLFFLPLLQIDIASSQLLKQELHLTAVRVYNLEVQLNRNHQGEWNHARLAPEKVEKASVEEQEEAATSFKFLVDTLNIHDGVVFFEDQFPGGGFSTVAREINIDVKNFALDAQEAIPLVLSLETDRDESVEINGQFLLKPFSLDLQAELRDIAMGAYEPYYQDAYSAPLGGKVGLQASLEINPEQPLLISNGVLNWREAYMSFNEQEGLEIALIDISDLSFDLAKNRLEVGSARYEDGHANFSRSREGDWSFFSRNVPILTKQTEAPDRQPEPTVAKPDPAFSYLVRELTIENWAFDVTDNLPATSATLKASNFNLTFNNLASPAKTESPFTFSTSFQDTGRIEIKGTASLAEQSVRMQTELKGISLASFAPYVAEQLELVLADGYIDARLKSTVHADSRPLKIAFGGDIGINRFHLLDALHQEDLLKWESLQIAGITGEMQPLALGIESITLNDYFAKVLIDEKARLNLVEAFSKPGTADTSLQETSITTDVQQSTTEEGRDKTATPSDIDIGTVTLQGGRIDFTDRSLPRPFHADMRELGGRILGLSSEPETRATVDLRGSLRNQSPLTISGTINPLADELFLDLKLIFNDIELSPLSVYSGTYVGYLIKKGKLNLTLEYDLEDGQLKARNSVFLDQFTFGEAVDSDKAISLPVKLAVALLKDRRGEIHLDIPVYGSLDDPQFSVTGVIWTVIKNLLVKAATSPFALLGALVGGGDEDFSYVNFEYGSARLSSAAKETLQPMAQALSLRPGLDVEVSGFIDPDKDAEGYRREQLSKQIKRLNYLELVSKGELPEGLKEQDVTVTAEEYADYLWQVYRETDFPKPRSFIGMTKKLPETEMEKLIYANTSVTEDQLADLAQARALAVQDFLVEEGQLARERIFLKEVDIKTPPDEETISRARVEFDAAVH